MSLMNLDGGLGGRAAAPVMTALLCTATFITTGVSAGTPDVPSIRVSYKAADLTEPEGARRLYVRIQRAAKLVCHQPDIRDLDSRAVYQQCYDQAVDNAVAEVNASALTALHRSKTQRNATG